MVAVELICHALWKIEESQRRNACLISKCQTGHWHVAVRTTGPGGPGGPGSPATPAAPLGPAGP